jgi:hypothetical protein
MNSQPDQAVALPVNPAAQDVPMVQGVPKIFLLKFLRK